MKVEIDEAAWTANANIETWTKVPKDADPPQAYRFTLPNRTDVITALVTDAGMNIEIYPDRSASQRALKVALGL